MGFPMRKAAGRAALIGVMLGGGMLYAGISQAQEAGAQDVQAERTAELVAATGGPASGEHLRTYGGDKAGVEQRDDDVAPVAPVPAPASVTTAAAQATPADPYTPGQIASAAVSR